MSEALTVRNYILENFLFSQDDSALNNADSLLGKGIVDSTGMLELVSFLEQQFSVKVADTELVPENLDSVNNIVAFLGRKRAA